MATNNTSNMCVTIGSAQQIMMPIQPTFYVSLFNTQFNTTGDGTVYTCVWDHEYVDQGSNFAANTFNTPVTGIFLLSTTMFLDGIDITNTKAVLSIVTTSHTYSKEFNPGTTRSLFDAFLCVSNTTICPMTAGDTAIVQLTVSNAAKTIAIIGDNRDFYQNTAFYGSLIC